MVCSVTALVMVTTFIWSLSMMVLDFLLATRAKFVVVMFYCRIVQTLHRFYRNSRYQCLIFDYLLWIEGLGSQVFHTLEHTAVLMTPIWRIPLDIQRAVELLRTLEDLWSDRIESEFSFVINFQFGFSKKKRILHMVARRSMNCSHVLAHISNVYVVLTYVSCMNVS